MMIISVSAQITHVDSYQWGVRDTSVKISTSKDVVLH